MTKTLALNINGDMTYCSVPPEMRGKGRCNHIAHKEENETTKEFLERVADLQEEASNKALEDDPFVPQEGILKTKAYRMTEEEKRGLTLIQNRMQLDQNIDGGVMELDEPLWNDMDKNCFSEISGLYKRDINAVIHGEKCIILESNDDKNPVGKVITPEKAESLMGIKTGTGVKAMNQYAENEYHWKATKDIYVIPYYMRMGSEEVDSDITIGYKYLLRNHANPQQQQLAYEALLNNAAINKEKARVSNGYRNKSLADEFAGKSGVFRAYLTGNSIPYSGRAVISPSLDMQYGEVRIPPTIVVDIFRPTLLKQLTEEGKSEEEIDDFLQKYRVEQRAISDEDRMELERRIAGKRVAFNRQPSLHTSSFQGMIPKVSPDATIKIHPLYCTSYSADFDGDESVVYAFNETKMNPLVDEAIGALNKINTHKPGNLSKNNIMPTKDALFGLLNILEKRS